MQRAYNPGLVMFMAFMMSMLTSLNLARAQDGAPPGIMSNGDAAVTGFSGTQDQNGQPVINTNGASVRVLSLSQAGSNTPAKFEAFARDVGQVFGVALDGATPANIYVTATSAYGLSLVKPDANGGVPQKATTGGPGATFMPGQFGPNGGPGSVWKIDGKTGAISLFANIPNSTAGLGNISYDATHYQFFVSDLESGLIHRVGMDGQVIDTFDHGSTGRPAGGLDAVENDPAGKADITSPDFDTENADTWGMTDVRRRVWGLAFHNKRLYYSPTEGPQVWSVGINTDGSFAADAAIEIQTVPGGFPVSDMLFTTNGTMVISQRGGQLGSADYSQFHTPGNNAVMRYNRDENGQWIQEPQQYAIGMTPDHKNASGGVGLACGNVLWSTGDALTGDPAQTIHGLQSSRINDVRPANTPPQSSTFVDFDGQFNDPQKAGHVGDVEVYRNCPKRADGFVEPRWPGWTPEWTPPEGWYPPEWWPRFPDLRLIKRNTRCNYVRRSLIVECKFRLIVTNVGAVVYNGPLTVVDNVPANFKYVPPPGGNIPWQCQQPGGAGQPISCNSVNIETLFPGQSATLILKMRKVGGNPRRRIFKNCAILEVPDEFLFNNEDCGFGRIKPPKRRYCPKGWTRYPTQGSVPNGWFSKKINGLICAKPRVIIIDPIPLPGPKCRRNETRFNNPAAVPAGWSSRRVSRNGRSIWCAKRPIIVDPIPLPGPRCRRNETRFFNPAAVPAGWSSRRVSRNGRTIWCAKRPIIVDPIPLPGPRCRRNETRYFNPANIPARWSSRRVSRNGRTIWCATPRIIVDPTPRPGPQCARGERRYRNAGQVPRGWSWRRVSRNGRTVICAKPRRVICKPGTRLVRGRCIPIHRPILCKRGQRRVGNRCVPIHRPILCKRGQRRVGNRCVPIHRPILCKRGQRRVGNRCVPIRVQIRCKRGTYRVGNRCIPTRVQIRCKRGTHKVGNRCVPNVRTHTPRLPRHQVIPGLRRCPSGMRPSNGRCVRG